MITAHFFQKKDYCLNYYYFKKYYQTFYIKIINTSLYVYAVRKKRNFFNSTDYIYAENTCPSDNENTQSETEYPQMIAKLYFLKRVTAFW